MENIHIDKTNKYFLTETGNTFIKSDVHSMFHVNYIVKFGTTSLELRSFLQCSERDDNLLELQ